MHTIYTTPGFIIGSRPYGDAGKILSIFTRDFGLIYATALGIRLEKSKLRYQSQDYTFGTYSLVGGREYWRLTSAITDLRSSIVVEDKFKIYDLRSEAKELIARLALLLRRLLHGEDAHPELFDHIDECVKFLWGEWTLDKIDLETLESLIVGKMLQALGYIGKMPESLERILLAEISIEALQRLTGERAILNQHINKALHESML